MNKHFGFIIRMGLVFIFGLLVVIVWQPACGKIVEDVIGGGESEQAGSAPSTIAGESITSSTLTATTTSLAPTTTGPNLYDVRFNQDGNVGIACGEQGTVLRTTNGGATWSIYEPADGSLSRYDEETFYWCYSGHGMQDSDSALLGTDGTWLLSHNNDDGWFQVDSIKDLDVTETIYGEDMISQVNYLATASNGELYRSLNYHEGFSKIESGTRADLYCHASNGDTVVVVGANGTILRSTDIGLTFSTVSEGTYPDLYRVAYDETTSLFLAIGAGGTFLSSTDGLSWQNYIDVPNDVTLYNFGLMNNLVLLVGSNGTVLVSRDRVNLTAIDTRTTVNLRAMESINGGRTAFVVGDNLTVLKTTNSGAIWQLSTDGGQTWSDSWAVTLP
ncbi:MAG: hypothetical protein ABH823_01345 [bacterium]